MTDIRRPMGEVTHEWADGGSYIKTVLDTTAKQVLNDAYKRMADLDAEREKEVSVQLKDEDVEFVMAEFELSRAEAEKKLRAQGGDLNRTLRAFVGLPQEESS